MHFLLTARILKFGGPVSDIAMGARQRASGPGMMGVGEEAVERMPIKVYGTIV